MVGWRGDEKGKRGRPKSDGVSKSDNKGAPGAGKRPRDQGNEKQKSSGAGGSWKPTDQGGSGSSDKSDQRWQEQRPSQIPRPLRLAFWCLACFVFLGALIRYVWTRPTQVPLISLAVTEYSPTDLLSGVIPPNSWAAEDVDRLLKVNTDNIIHESLPAPGNELTADGLKGLKDRLRDAFAADGGGGTRFADGGGPSRRFFGTHERNLIIHLSMHGAVDGDGKPCLLLCDANPFDSRTWLPVEELLDEIEAHRSEFGSSGTRVVLLLDCGRMSVNPQMGIFASLFPGSLRKLVESRPDTGILIVVSHGDGQRSWDAPELGGTVFGRAIADALQGEADRTGNDDGEVSFQEFTRHVTRYVSSWVHFYRGEEQIPEVIHAKAAGGEPVEFPLTYAGPRLEPTSKSFGRFKIDGQKLDKLTDLWKSHDELAKLQARRRFPVAFARLERLLTAMEPLLHAGGAYAEAFDAYAAEAERLITNEMKPENRPKIPATSFAINERINGTEFDSERILELQSWINRPQPEGEVPRSMEPPVIPDERRRAAWVWLLNRGESCSKAELQRAVTFAEGGESSGLTQGSPNVESQFARMLNVWPDWGAAAVASQLARNVNSAIKCREIAEVAAAPVDPRAQYWSQSLVDQADTRRRLAEDQLYVGTPELLSQSQATFDQLLDADDQLMDAEQTGNYPDAVRIADEISHAFAVRDRALSEIPEVIRWLVDDAGRIQDAKKFKRLQKLLDDLSTLIEELDRFEMPDRVVAVEQTLGTMVTHIRDKDEYSRASTDKLTSAESVVFEELLKSSLISGERRETLREHLLEWYVTDHSKFELAPLETDRARNSEEETSAADSLRHPLLQYLDKIVPPVYSDPSSDPDLEGPVTAENSPHAADLAQQGGEYRKRILRILQVAGRKTAQAKDKLSSGLAQADESARVDLVVAERLVRVVAPLHPGASRNDDPAELRGKLDLHNFCLWHARRIAEDFWGPDPADSAEPWFKLAGDRMSLAARSQVSRATTNPHHITEVETLLSERLTTHEKQYLHAVSELLVTVQRTSVVDGIPHDIQVSAPQSSRPSGLASFYFENQSKLLPIEKHNAEKGRVSVRRRPFPVSGTLSSQSFAQLIPEELIPEGKSSGTLAATTLFRGHLYPWPFQIDLVDDEFEQVKTHMSLSGESKVSVSGNAKLRPRINFILDCSQSMRTYDFPNAEDPARRLQRGQLCKNTLKSTINKLTTDTYDVGLAMYGHRAYWVITPEGGAIARLTEIGKKQPLKAGDRAGQLDPSRDANQEIPVGQFTADKRGEILGLLDEAEFTHGAVSPLYLALIKSIKELDQPDFLQHPRYVVVLTDGVNYVESNDPRPDDKTLEDVKDVIDLVNSSKSSKLDHIQIHLVFFGDDLLGSAKDTEKLQREELERFVETTGGRTHGANDASSLQRVLDKALGLLEYSVATTESPDSAIVEEKLGHESTIKGTQHSLPGPFTIRLKVPGEEKVLTENIRLEGGEHLRLLYDRFNAPDRLQFLPFAPDDIVPDAKTGQNFSDVSDVSGQFRLRLHRPIRDREIGGRNIIRFPVSIQAGTDEPLFTPRPRAIHAEVMSVQEAGLPLNRHVLCDMKFEPGQPVPVIPLTVPSWTPDSGQAEIKLWFSMDDVPSDFDILVSECPDLLEPPEIPSGLGTFKVESRNEQGGYSVTVTHEGSTAPHAVRVELSLPASAVTRRYYSVPKGRTTHSFLFDSQPDMSRLKLRLTKTENFKAHALTTEQPLNVLFSE